MTSKSKALKGYKSRDSGTHRTYNFQASIARYNRTGKFVNKGNGSGHAAGTRWAESKQIDPDSLNQKYSKNSPSFDEGVYKYKQSAKSKALTSSVK